MSPAVQTYNMVRKCITGYFRTRNCVTLPPPVAAEHLKNLSNIPIEALNPVFNAKMDAIEKMVREKAPIKSMPMTEVVSTSVDGAERQEVRQKIYNLNGSSTCVFID